MRVIATTPISTRATSRSGTTEMIWSTAEEVETATVMT